MKLAFWGGPLDGQIKDVPRLGPIHHREPTVEPVGWRDAPDRYDLVDLKTITYWPQQLVLGDGRRWWVMVSGDLTEGELMRLQAQREHPMIDTQGRGLTYLSELPEPKLRPKKSRRRQSRGLQYVDKVL